MAEKERGIYFLKNVIKKREKGGSIFELSVEHFDILKGDFVAIVGQSGCGKSTLLDMLGLVLTPSSADNFFIQGHDGEKGYNIEDAGEQQLAKIRKKYIGYVLQTGGLLPFLSVSENIALPCVLNKQTGYQAHIHNIVKRLQIENQVDKKPQFLSGGQRQRVAIARALAHKPSIVLADEPTAAVDKDTAEDIIAEFKTLTEEIGVTLIMVTHDTNLVAGTANRFFGFELERIDRNHVLSKCVEKEPREIFEGIGGKK